MILERGMWLRPGGWVWLVLLGGHCLGREDDGGGSDLFSSAATVSEEVEVELPKGKMCGRTPS